jgi:TrmH family RNA methyltransferase
MPENSLNAFHIILVEPAESLNVGAVARAMMNLGFRHLHLVAPVGYDRTRAAITACWAEPLLDSLVIHERFEDAIADMQLVVGLSGRTGKNREPYTTLPEWVSTLPARPIPKTALVFGPEDNGLRQEYLDLCRWIIRIPSTEENPSFNLAQATLLVLYEIQRTFAPLTDHRSPTTDHRLADAPTGNDYQQLDRLVEAVMTESGFLRDGTPAPVPGTIRNLFRRLDLNPQEMGILLGLFNRVYKSLRYGSPTETPPASHDGEKRDMIP